MDKKEARRNLGIPPEGYIGLNVGRWDITKGCDILEGVMRSAEASSVYWVVVAGTGSDRNIIPSFQNVRGFDHIQTRKNA